MDETEKLELQEGLRKILGADVSVLCELFDRLILFDFGKEEFWWLPKFQQTTENTYRVGWMYWALAITKLKKLKGEDMGFLPHIQC